MAARKSLSSFFSRPAKPTPDPVDDFDFEAETRKIREEPRASPSASPETDPNAEYETEQLLALTRVHSYLSKNLGKPLDDKKCPSCRSPMIVNRAAIEGGYTLLCPNRCKRLLVNPDQLVRTFGGLL